MRMFKIFIAVGIATLLIGTTAFAQSFKTTGNPLDNAAGEVFTAELTQETMNYKDSNLNTKPTTLPASDISFTVSAEYGFSMLGTETGSAAATPGVELIQGNYYVTNEGDTADVYTLEAIFIQDVGSSTWQVSLISTEGSVNLTNMTAGSLTTQTRNVADDDDFGYHYVVTPDATADDGEQITIYSTVETGATPVGEYTGGNALTYSGTSTATDSFSDTISSPELVISRVAVVDSPDVYDVTYGDTDPVPGAIITFTYTYTNEGASAAQDVILLAKVPTIEPIKGTNLAHVNGTGDHGNVTITPAGGTATGWTVSYATITSPATTYGATADWTQIGTVTGNQYPSATGLYETGSSEYQAKWIKWEKASVPDTDDNVTITWGVTIR